VVKTGFLLDTNVLSELRKGARAHPGVRNWAAQCPYSHMYVSVVSLMELKFGILSALRKDPPFGSLLQNWYESRLKPSFAGRALPVSLPDAERWADLQAVRTLPFRDGLIAATALHHHLQLVTRNTPDFEGLGLNLINPWLPNT